MKRRWKQLGLLGIMAGLLVSLFLASSHGSNARAAARRQRVVFDTAKYFPLNVGDEFRYQVTGDGEKETRDVELLPTTLDGAPVIARMEFLEDGVLSDMEFLVSDETQGILNYGDEDPIDDCSTRLSPPLRIPNGLRLGETFHQTVQVEATGTGADDTKTIDVAVQFKGLVTTKVPAGKFEDCAKIEMTEIRKDANGRVLEREIAVIIFAPYIGIIKIEEGGEVTKLIWATVGVRESETVPGRF
jgi:hypothetical protein